MASLVSYQLYLAGLESSNPSVLLRLRDRVGAGCNRHSVNKMTATGVPPHLVLANSVVHLQHDMGVIREEIIAK
jgi:hypothetical protein